MKLKISTLVLLSFLSINSYAQEICEDANKGAVSHLMKDVSQISKSDEPKGPIKILIYDDLGTAKADFKFNKQKKNGVSISAEIKTTDCPGDGFSMTCLDRVSTESLPFLSREGREVFYTHEGQKIYCGQALNLASRGDMLVQNCRLEIEEEKVCVEYFAENDCIQMKKKHRAYLIINI